MRIPASLSRWGRYLRSLLTNGYFLGGLAVLTLLGLGLYFVVNTLIMPAYTRHDVAVTVPDVRNQPFEEARQILARYDLQAERDVQRFNPNLPRDVVIDQNPPAASQVKPGRRIYLTVNSGRTPMVTLPNVVNLSLREASYRLQALGLTVQDVRPDSIPSPHRNTVTRQDPAPGDSLAKGSSVTLWYSTGLGDRYVDVPDVVGLQVEAARRQLLQQKLRSVVVDAPARVHAGGDGTTPPSVPDSTLVVVRQSQEPGTRVREGFEIRLFVDVADSLRSSTSGDTPGNRQDRP
ncbi:hypothetical protein AWN76_011915 [Rhodothermaceae bacterium RA]|nr:hypothetical protein AWN76_011915 [Rhodothermaceae bacterium RA]